MAHVRSLFFKGPLDTVENRAVKAYKLGRPSDVIWNITNRCNLLCDHCYMAADGHIRPDELSDEEAIALVRQMGERGLPALFLSGGEPMMRKNFWEILELARSLRHPRDRLHELHAHGPRGRKASSRRRHRLDRDVALRSGRVPRRDGPRAGHSQARGRSYQDPARRRRQRRHQDRDQQGDVALHLRPHRRGQGARRRPPVLLRPDHRRPQRGRGRRPHHRRAMARAGRLHHRGHPRPRTARWSGTSARCRASSPTSPSG